MDPEKKPDDKKELTEEEILELIEELKKHKQNKQIAISLGFLLHPNYVYHLAISFGINILLSAVVFGLSAGINQAMVQMTALGFFIAMTLLTGAENFIKILLFRYLPRAMIMSMGTINVMTQILILFGIDQLLEVGFHFNGIESLIIFSVIFSIFRLVFSTYLRKAIYARRMKNRG
ncbi:MAG: hypothetical protein WCW63_00575 [Acholeplasmataceae bacterium]|jgi:hypothetical protein